MATIKTDIKDAERHLTMLDMSAITKKGNLTRAIRKELRDVQKVAQTGFHSRIKSDPRKMVQAIRIAVYKKVIGGKITLENSKSLSKFSYDDGKKHPRESADTRRTRMYYGIDRAFIARILQVGKARRGNHATGWFDVTDSAMVTAADNVSRVVEDEIEKVNDKFK